MKEEQLINAHANLLFSKGYEPMMIALYGSQNYNLATALSDVDSKAIVMPRISHFLKGKRIDPKVIPTLGGQIDVKDIRDMFDNYLKSNINFLETLFTNHFWSHQDFFYVVNELRANREWIASYSPRSIMKSCAGMAQQKYKKLYDLKNATYNDTQVGYITKELCHLLRLNYFMLSYAKGFPFCMCLKPNDKRLDQLFDIKDYFVPKDQADYLARKALRSNELMLEQCPIMKAPDDHKVAEWLREVANYAIAMQGKHVFNKIDFDEKWVDIYSVTQYKD